MTRLPGAPWIIRGEAPACRAGRGTGAGDRPAPGTTVGPAITPGQPCAAPAPSGPVAAAFRLALSGAAWAADQHLTNGPRQPGRCRAAGRANACPLSSLQPVSAAPKPTVAVP